MPYEIRRSLHWRMVNIAGWRIPLRNGARSVNLRATGVPVRCEFRGPAHNKPTHAQQGIAVSSRVIRAHTPVRSPLPAAGEGLGVRGRPSALTAKTRLALRSPNFQRPSLPACRERKPATGSAWHYTICTVTQVADLSHRVWCECSYDDALFTGNVAPTAANRWVNAQYHRVR